MTRKKKLLPLEAAIAATPEPAVKKARKPRSDKGKPRGPRKPKGDPTPTPAVAVAAPPAAAPPPKSETEDAGHKLHREIEAAKSLLANLSDILGDDEVAKHDAVEGETHLHEAIVRGLSRLAEIDILRSGIKHIKEQLAARDARLEAQKDSLRTAMEKAMDVARESRIECPLGTISRKPTPQQLLVLEESQIPTAWWKRPDPVLDRKGLRDALRADSKLFIPGVTLDNGGFTVAVNWR
jgi:hypothetical protein